MILNVQASDRYALDGASVIRHVVTSLVRAQRALTVSDFKYSHHLVGDISRVKSHEKIISERGANEWLVKWALTQLGPEQIEEIDGTHYQLKIPHDQVKWYHTNGRVDDIHLMLDDTTIWPGGSEPFSELNGKFYHNIRVEHERDDLTELRESMRDLGWVKEFPALLDERGVVLVGHRRLKVAEELGIAHETVTIIIGKGAQADARRLKIAIASNIGFRHMSAESRRNLAAYLYADLEWSMEKIGEALRVSHAQISYDLKDSKKPRCKSLTTHTDTLGRPNTGRIVLTDEEEANIIQLRENGESIKAITDAMSANGRKIGRRSVTRVLDQEDVRRAAQLNPRRSDTTTETKPEPVKITERRPVSEPEPEPEPVVVEPEPVTKTETVICDHILVCKKCGEVVSISQ